MISFGIVLELHFDPTLIHKKADRNILLKCSLNPNPTIFPASPVSTIHFGENEENEKIGDCSNAQKCVF